MDHSRAIEEPELNADPEAQLRLLELQQLDSRLDLIAHRRRTLPELAEIERLGGQVATLRDQLVVAETEASDVEREQTKADADVEQVRQRATRDQQRLHSGAVGSAKELESLQHEIGSLSRRQAELEDVELEIMERLEEIQGRVSKLRTELEGTRAESIEAVRRRDTAFSEHDRDAQFVQQQRDAVLKDVPADLLNLYEKLRADLGGVGAAPLRQRRCEGCRLELNATEISHIRAAAPDEVLRCEECRRILVRTPESGL